MYTIKKIFQIGAGSVATRTDFSHRFFPCAKMQHLQSLFKHGKICTVGRDKKVDATEIKKAQGP